MFIPLVAVAHVCSGGEVPLHRCHGAPQATGAVHWSDGNITMIISVRGESVFPVTVSQ